MLRKLRTWRNDESGAITVDWVVLLWCSVALSVAIIANVIYALTVDESGLIHKIASLLARS